MPKPSVTLQQQQLQLQRQRQMQHGQGDPSPDRGASLPERQDQPPRDTRPGHRQGGSADQ